MAFDLKTQRLNKKGQVVSKQPYRLFIERGVQKFERPPGSGNFFTSDGAPLASQKVDKKAEAKKIADAKVEAKKQKEILPEVAVEVEVSDEMADLKADLMQDEE